MRLWGPQLRPCNTPDSQQMKEGRVRPILFKKGNQYIFGPAGLHGLCSCNLASEQGRDKQQRQQRISPPVGTEVHRVDRSSTCATCLLLAAAAGRADKEKSSQRPTKHRLSLCKHGTDSDPFCSGVLPADTGL